MVKLKTWLAATVLCSITLLATGCATIAASHAETAKYQALADQATTQLHLAPVAVVLTAGIHGRYTCDSRRLELGTEHQLERVTRWVLAHELGHALLGVCGDSLENEQNANAAAVRVLQTWGMTETDAAQEVGVMLWTIAKSGEARGMVGHDMCAELIDLLRRFPTVPHSAGSSTCPALKAGSRP
jgi:hypothetical protein